MKNPFLIDISPILKLFYIAPPVMLLIVLLKYGTENSPLILWVAVFLPIFFVAQSFILRKKTSDSADTLMTLSVFLLILSLWFPLTSDSHIDWSGLSFILVAIFGPLALALEVAAFILNLFQKRV